MSKFQSPTAHDALAVLDRFEKVAEAANTGSSTADGIAQLCKRAGVDAAETDYLVKFARFFESYSTLSTDELIKLALSRFLKDRKTDSLIAGIKQAADNDQALTRATLVLLDGQKVASTEDAALMAELEKRAAGIAAKGLGMLGKVPGLGRLLGGGGGAAAKGVQQMFPFAAKGGGGLARGAGQAAGRIGRSLSGPGGTAKTLAIGAGGWLGMRGAGKGVSGLYGQYGAPAGERRALESMADMVGDMRDPGAITQYIQQLQGLGGEITPKMWQALTRGFAHQINPNMYA
jgi:hypothetical protein